MKRLTKSTAPLVAAALFACGIGVAAACGFDAPLGNTFVPMHPKSLTVAYAVRDAVVAGTIDPATDPAAEGQKGYWRAVGRLTSLQRALSAVHGDDSVAVSVLFIDSGLWARLSPTPDGFAMQPHTESSQPGDVVVVTSELVLSAILDHRLTAASALERGLMVIDGDAGPVKAVSALIADGFAAPAAKRAAAPPSRLFGPAR